jgi:predicted phage baseplate assembly protein
MSLPSPNLDDRTFQDIVDDVKRQIGQRCPEWTDHNVSDPGVTLIELFAWMTEMSLYRMNQVPEKNYIKFLEMLGVSLEPPAPALTDLRFLLSRPIEDRDGEEGFERTLRARETVAATIRTESEDAIEFASDRDLRMVRPRLRQALSIPAATPGTPGDENANGNDFMVWRAHRRKRAAARLLDLQYAAA